MKRSLAVAVSVALFSLLLPAQTTETRFKPSDDRMKADILVVVAHPDDEAAVFPYLAKAIYDESKRVAVVFATDGGGGGNQVARERASSLGAVRQVEARSALASFGVQNVWFLPNLDFATQDVLVSLGSWNHGTSVEEMVRLIRLTRPEVVFAFYPGVVAGENHGGHQASGVLATEAFDLAGDATAFPEQIATAVHRYERELDNLHPWQPKKLYYFSDASHAAFSVGKGPRYSAEEMSPSQKQTYFQLTAREFGFHETQGGRGVTELLKKNPSGIPEDWKYTDTGTADLYLIMGKSLVSSPTDADVFAGITSSSIPFAPSRGYEVPTNEPALQTGGPWAFYRSFWRAHNLDHLASLLEPEIEISAGSPFRIPLLVRNTASSPQKITITPSLPEGWKDVSGSGTYVMDPGAEETVLSVLSAPAVKKAEWHEVKYQALVDGKTVGSVVVKVRLRPHEGLELFDQ
jgi:LmbE family N-acetylglucosaminyl deacetylase